jgi:hypothetical protein
MTCFHFFALKFNFSLYDMGLDVDAPQQWSPRVFKAHLSPTVALRCHPGAGAYTRSRKIST